MTEYQSAIQSNHLRTHVQCEDSTAAAETSPCGSSFLGTNTNTPITNIPLPPTSSSRNSTLSIPTSPSEAARPQSDSSIQVHIQSNPAEDEPYDSLVPHFRSALSYTEVRDYAYPEFHPLHYGVPLEEDQGDLDLEDEDDEDIEDDEYPDSYMRDGGPPWKEDSDLASPVVISYSVGDRISKEYEFSIASADEIHGRAIALFDFIPENENEAPLREGQIIWVSYRHGQGWLVAEDPATGEKGLVPEEYVRMFANHETIPTSDAGLDLGDEENEDQEGIEAEEEGEAYEYEEWSNSENQTDKPHDYYNSTQAHQESHEPAGDPESLGSLDEGAYGNHTESVKSQKVVQDLADSLQSTTISKS